MSFKPNRSGKSWTQAEDDQLVDLNSKNIALDAMAVAHGRTEIAIKCRLMKHAKEAMDSNNLSLEEASAEFRVDARELQKFIAKEDGRLTGAPMASGNTEELLKEIRDLLKNVLEALNR